MADQTRKPKPKKDEDEAQAAKPAPTEGKSEVDDLLDEIDEVLETNAEEFVRGFVQKGGQAVAVTLQKLLPVITSAKAATAAV